MSEQKLHFSKVPDFLSFSNSEDDQSFRVILLPKKWWSITAWRFSIATNRNIRITGLTSKHGEVK